MDSETSRVASVLDESTQDAVRSHLMRILSSSFFRESPAASRFLSYVVETALSDQTNHIKQYTIAVDAFGYPDDFDPQTNPAMRIIAGRMRSMLERYYRHDGAHDDIRIEIPKRTYFPVFRFNSKTQKTGHARLSREPSLESIADYGLSIAVLPFGNRQSHENKGCADDITESIVVGLSQFHELHIVGPLLTYKDCTVETDQVARRYHVRFVLQGSVRIYGATLRVAANLTDAFTGFKVWSQTYEYTLTAQNLLEIEDDVSRLIVNALADYSGIIPCHISRESKKKNPDSMEIHEAICSQNLYMKVFSIETHRAAIEALERALKTNSDNPLAMAMLGTAYCCNDLFDLIPGTSRLDESERLVKQAEVLDPECQIAHLTEAVVRFVQGQADRCIAKIGLAISLNPFNAYVGHACGFMLGMLGHWEDGMQLWENATRLNPNHSPFYFMVPFMNHYRRGDYEKAWSYAVRFNVPIFWDPLIRAAAAGQLGMYPQAAASLEELLEMRPDFASRGRDLVRRLAYSDEHVEMLFEGLFKAGFQPNPTG